MAGPINGTNAATLQPVIYGRNDSGNYQRQTWRGGGTAVASQAASLASTAGIVYEVRGLHGNLAEVEANYPYSIASPTTDYVERWELFSSHGDKDLLNAVDYNGIVATLTNALKEKIRAAIEDPANNNTHTEYTITYFDPSASPSTAATNALLCYKLMRAGQTSYLMEAPVLRRTVITSEALASGYALTNVRRLMTTAYLAANEGLPGTLLFNLSTYFAGDTTSDPHLKYGWYKAFPNIQEVALRKWSINQEWHYGWWPYELMGAVLTTP